MFYSLSSYYLFFPYFRSIQWTK